MQQQDPQAAVSLLAGITGKAASALALIMQQPDGARSTTPKHKQTARINMSRAAPKEARGSNRKSVSPLSKGTDVDADSAGDAAQAVLTVMKEYSLWNGKHASLLGAVFFQVCGLHL